MKPEPFWMVVAIDSDIEIGFSKLPESVRPKHLHASREEAEKEALRLQLGWGATDRCYVVLEAVAWSDVRIAKIGDDRKCCGLIEPMQRASIASWTSPKRIKHRRRQ